jgi:hypothetical protein
MGRGGALACICHTPDIHVHVMLRGREVNRDGTQSHGVNEVPN